MKKEKIASDITIMEAMKSYFEYIVPSELCGIPEITLQGTPDDWQRVLDKTRNLEKYDLGWWTRELAPILEEFVRASSGKINKPFWQGMFKYHTAELCGNPDTIDGWMITFFPYDNAGRRNNLKEIKGGDSLPNEIVKVDLTYVDIVKKITTPLELWAGFIGLEQDNGNFALTPKIGWMIKRASMDYASFDQSTEIECFLDDFLIRVKKVPPEILAIKEIDGLSITFVDKIIIPDQMARIKIGRLSLFGKIDEAETKRIRAMFPNTKVYINGK